MNFKEWLNEQSTSTADVAHFARPLTGIVRRDWNKPRMMTFSSWEKKDEGSRLSNRKAKS